MTNDFSSRNLVRLFLLILNQETNKTDWYCIKELIVFREYGEIFSKETRILWDEMANWYYIGGF